MELQKKVHRLYVVERPLNRSGQSSAKKRVTHQGCVAVTGDGQHYLIEKGVVPDGLKELHRIGGDHGSRIVDVGEEFPASFTLVKEVKVTKAGRTLGEILEASGKDYNWICNNCWNSATKMSNVVNDELQLPWQFKLGIDIGLVAVFAMALMAIGRLVIGGAQRV